MIIAHGSIELRKKLPDLRAKITVVLCIKRHHTRMFPIQSERTDKLGNALPGTVIENSGGKDICMLDLSLLTGMANL